MFVLPRGFSLVFIGLLGCIIQPRANAQPAVSEKPGPRAVPSAPTLFTLPNGLRVIVAERRSARLVALDLRVRAGSAYESRENNGVAHLIEHLLFKGTTTRKPGDLDAAVESIGGELVANTSRDWAQFATVVPSSGWKIALEVLADAIRNPAFRSEDLDNERRVILDEMKTAEADPARAPFAALANVAYPPGHPYRLPLYGPESNVQGLRRDDLLSFWRARYTPSNMTLVVVGDVKQAEVVQATRDLFGTAQATPAPRVDLADPGAIEGVVRATPLLRDRDLVSVVVGFRAPSVRAAQDAVAMDVLLQILASEGRGRLPDALVRAGNLALTVSADYLTQRAPGLLTLTAIGPGGNEARLEAALLGEVQRLRDKGVTEEEVAIARRTLLGQMLFDEETFAGEANALAFYDAIDTLEFALRYRERIGAVDVEDIVRVVRTYLTPDRYAVATVVPRTQIPASPRSPLTSARSAEVTR